MYRNLIDKTEIITPSLFLFYLLNVIKISSIILDIRLCSSGVSW